MRINRLYLASVLALASAGIVGCSDNFDTPPMVIPSTNLEANITINELKTLYWNSDRNYIDTIGFAENGDSLYIKARVISSDESGNIYNCLYIQDETGSLPMSIRYPDMFNTYRVGQEVVLSVSGMYIGKYNGLQQLGQPEYTTQYGWEATFMTRELFESRVHLNGMPDVTKVDTIDINLGDLSNSTEDIIRLQGQLVRLRNVHFEEADGLTTFSDADNSTNRTVVDSDGNTIIMRNSSYADFQADLLPMGSGTIVAILSYYGTDWQLLLRDTDDLSGFTTETSGTKADPYTIEQAIELQGAASGWVTGYVVGAVAPEVTTITGNSDIEWEAPTTLDNTLVIGATADTRDISQCIVMELPQGSALRSAANLRDNPQVLGSQIWVTGTLDSYMGTYGLTGNSGSSSEYEMSVTNGGEASLYEDFEGGEVPSGWTMIESGGQDWWCREFDNNYYITASGYNSSGSATPPFNIWLITPALDVTSASEKVFSFRTQVNGYGATTTELKVYVLSTNDPATATKTDITAQAQWPTPPASGYSSWVESGDIDLSSYEGTIFIGFCYEATEDANYATWCMDDFCFGISSGTTPDPGPDDPDTPVSANRADFETFGDPTGYYNTFTSTDGWTATNCSLLAGTDDSSAESPYFQFIGYMTGSTTEFAYAPCMNGNTSRAGSIVSPTISGGCSELSFNFGIPFNESDPIGFRVDIKQNGSVVHTFNIEGSYNKGVLYTHVEENINVTGAFTIEFVNLSPSGLAENKNRVAVWNVTWTGNE